jgi:3-keto-5-aminohexanoate cleavage enzyme
MAKYDPERKMIVTVAVNGSVPKKEDNPHVPVTPEEVVEDSLKCAEAGASVVHIHARDEEEEPCHDYEFFQECVEQLRAQSDLIIQLSTGARVPTPREVRIQAVDLRPDMMSLNAGCCNFPNGPYVNSVEDIEFWLEKMNAFDVRPEVECFDVSHMHTGIALHERGLIESPVLFNLVLGVKGALPFTPHSFMHMWDTVPDDAQFNVTGVARSQLPLSVLSTILGGHVRVGLEDNLYYSYGELATNVELVERAVRIANEAQREVATPAEARELLGIVNS